MDVHSVLRESLKSRNLSLSGPDRMDNLLKVHIEHFPLDLNREGHGGFPRPRE
jgi:hypothetical protein